MLTLLLSLPLLFYRLHSLLQLFATATLQLLIFLGALNPKYLKLYKNYPHFFYSGSEQPYELIKFLQIIHNCTTRSKENYNTKQIRIINKRPLKNTFEKKKVYLTQNLFFSNAKGLVTLPFLTEVSKLDEPDVFPEAFFE